MAQYFFLIFISDISEGLESDIFIYVDDTKAVKKIESVEDVINLQEDLYKLHQWSLTNNMVYNGGKFVSIRYGKDIEMKESTLYFSGDTEEIIEEKESIRDLGVIMQNDASFTKQVEKVSAKARQKAGWVQRSFYCKQGWFLRHMWNTLVQPHLDYCSQLWAPCEGQDLQNIEKILKDYTSRIPEVQHLNYWERLKVLKMNSLQRRFERYKIIYVWKILEGLVPKAGVTLAPEDERKGRLCQIPSLKPKERKKRECSFQVTGPRLFNSLPKYLRGIKKCSVEEFKEKLDELMGRVPDEPKIGGLMPMNFHQSNSLIHQLPKRRLSPSWAI